MMFKVMAIVVLLLAAAVIVYMHQKDHRSDFERWLTNPDDRNSLTKQMLARQAEELAEREAADKRRAAILSLTESQLIDRLPSFSTGEEMSAALERLVMIGKDDYWAHFQVLYTSEKICSPAEHVSIALTERKKESGVSVAFFGRLYDFAVQKLSTRGSPRELVDILILIDQIRALKEFHDAKWHDFKSDAFASILETLNQRGLLLDKPTVTALLRDIPADESVLSFGSPVGELVVLAQRTGIAEFEDVAYRLMSQPKIDEYQASRLADAICAQYGFPDIDEYMSEKYKKEVKREFPFDKGDDLYKAWVSIGSLDGQVKNGGFAQYFGNGYGYQFTAAIKAVDAVGDKAIHDILVSVRNEFDRRGKPGDYSSEKLGEIYDKFKDKLDETDGNYFSKSNLLYARLKLYLVSRIKDVDLLNKLQTPEAGTSGTEQSPVSQ